MPYVRENSIVHFQECPQFKIACSKEADLYHDIDFTAVNYKGMKKGVEKMFSIHTKEK